LRHWSFTLFTIFKRIFGSFHSLGRGFGFSVSGKSQSLFKFCWGDSPMLSSESVSLKHLPKSQSK